MLSFFGLLFNLGAIGAESVKESLTPKTPALHGQQEWDEVLRLMVGKSQKEARQIYHSYCVYKNNTR